jgi:membrane glycosyltransferase
MNTRLFAMRGLHPAHRAMFVTGVMAYASAPLWLLSLILATALVAVERLTLPQYFFRPFQMFPVWPEWHPERALMLLSFTAALLFLPKILASLLIEARRQGGHVRLATSVLLECIMSALLAPIRMLFHTQFVLASLVGRGVRWRSPKRADAQTGWAEAVRYHGFHTVLGVVWAWAVWWIAPDFLAWLLPVVGPMMLSIPLSMCTSRIGAGKALRRLGLLLIPEETATPPVLVAMRQYLSSAAGTIDSRLNARPTGAIVASIETRDARAPTAH